MTDVEKLIFERLGGEKMSESLYVAVARRERDMVTQCVHEHRAELRAFVEWCPRCGACRASDSEWVEPRATILLRHAK